MWDDCLWPWEPPPDHAKPKRHGRIALVLAVGLLSVGVKLLIAFPVIWEWIGAALPWVGVVALATLAIVIAATREDNPLTRRDPVVSQENCQGEPITQPMAAVSQEKKPDLTPKEQERLLWLRGHVDVVWAVGAEEVSVEELDRRVEAAWQEIQGYTEESEGDE